MNVDYDVRRYKTLNYTVKYHVVDVNLDVSIFHSTSESECKTQIIMVKRLLQAHGMPIPDLQIKQSRLTIGNFRRNFTKLLHEKYVYTYLRKFRSVRVSILNKKYTKFKKHETKTKRRKLRIDIKD